MSNRWASAASIQVAGRLGVVANLPLLCSGAGVVGLLPPARLEPSKTLQMYFWRLRQAVSSVQAHARR